MSYVVLDLETSGLDARSDAIIEIALIRYTDLGVEEERYTSLVHPGFLISQEITHITSITPNDLIDAPVFSEIREKIIEFIDDDTIVGHNIDFDIGFLVEYAVISRDHSRIDTFRLAEIVAIDAKSLNLSSLLEYFGEPHVDAHRALADTEATGRLFQRLLERLLSLPTECRALFLSVVGRTGMDHEFRLVLDYIHLTEDSSTTPWRESLLARSRPSRIIDRPSGEIPTFTEVLDRATHLEERPEQKKMLQIVSDTLSQRSQSCIEAPTGVGKTIAYFLPSVLHALSTGTQVCISTHTRTLQDQIEYKDIPKIRSLLEPFWLQDFRIQKLKGRSNYASLLRSIEYIEQEKFEGDEAVFALKMGFWLMTSVTGELDDLSFYGREYEYRELIDATDSRVISPENPYKDLEYIVRAREGSKTADIIIVNHSLLLTDTMDSEGASRILPKIESLVLDEVHNLESVATESLKEKLDIDSFERTISEVERYIKKYNKAHPSDSFIFPEAREQAEGMMLAVSLFFEELEIYFLDVQSQNTGGYGGGRQQDILIEAPFYTTDRLERLQWLLSSIENRVGEYERFLYLAPEALMRELDRPIGYFERFRTFLRSFLRSEDTGLIRIFGKRENKPLQIIQVPLRIGALLEERLWQTIPSIIATSATLQVADSFTYIDRVLSLENFQKHVLETDFDYAKQALLYLPSNLGDVRKDDQKRAIEGFISDIIEIYHGRILMLFTSFSAIRDMTLAVSPLCKKEKIRLLTQGMSGGKHKMVSEFMKHSDHSVLFGTESFWEWVDFSGDMLQILIIHKFPFAVPTDPLYVARSRLYRDHFNEYSLPMMILKLRQGMGRLIRSKTDTGMIILLDKRIETAWGDSVLASLPKWLPIRRAKTEDLVPLLRTSRQKFAPSK